MSMESIRYELDEMLSMGFRDDESFKAYQILKEEYEEDTGNNEFSIRELTERLDYIIHQQDFDWNFQSLPNSIFEEYMILVGKLYFINKKEAMTYLKWLDVAELEDDRDN